MTRFAVLLACCVSHFGGVVQAQADGQPSRLASPLVSVTSSASSPTAFFVDVVNRRSTPITALGFEVLIGEPQSGHPQRLGFTHDLSATAGTQLGDDVGPIRYGVSRRFVVEMGEPPPRGARVTAEVTSAIYRNGQVFGDGDAARAFVRHRLAQARELGALVSIVDQARRLPPATARERIADGLAERTQRPPDPDLREITRFSLRDMLRQAVAGDDADLPVRLFHLRNTLRLMQQNAESPVDLPNRE